MRRGMLQAKEIVERHFGLDVPAVLVLGNPFRCDKRKMNRLVRRRLIFAQSIPQIAMFGQVSRLNNIYSLPK